MSAPYIYQWLPVVGNTAAIAPLQPAILAGGNVALNSSVPGYPGPFIYNGVIRSIFLVSTSNLSNATFSISGIGSPVLNGNPTQVIGPITEILVGPNAGSVESVNIYSQITSITVNAQIQENAIEVGFGSFGITDYCFFDYNRPYFQAYCQVSYSNYAALSTTIYQSLSKPQVINPDAGNLINVGPPPALAVADLSNIDTPEGALAPLLSSGLAWAKISGTVGDSAIITFLQQGIR